MSLDLDAFEFIVPIVSPCAVLLLVVTEVDPDWAYPVWNGVFAALEECPCFSF